VLAGLMALVLTGGVASADGKAYFWHAKDASGARPLRQDEQRAAILCRDGIERLVIAVNIRPEYDAQAVWLFPVLGTPDKVTVDVADAFPAFEGTNPFRRAQGWISLFGTAARATQLWPLFFEFLFPALGRALGPAVVHTEVEKWGIRAETVTAGSVAALAAYLEEKGRALPAEELDAFKPYLTDGHVLVVAWISSQDELRAKFPLYHRPAATRGGLWPCLYVEFPSEKPFYPMRPTSTYGEDYMEFTLFLVGYLAAEQEPQDAWERHFWASKPPEAGPARFLEALPRGRFAYTILELSGKAQDFTEDLWFKAAPEPSTWYAFAVARAFQLPWGFVTYAVGIMLLSYVAGGLTGLLMFREWKPYARVALWNVLTLLVLNRAVQWAKDSRGRPLRWWRGEGFWCISFPFVFSVVFVIVTMFAQFLLSLPLPG
jgi:hypothetical protein